MVGVIQLEAAHDNKRNWKFYREPGAEMLWGRIDA